MSTRYRTIILFGPPGAGKSTQAKLLCSQGGFFVLATGELFRSIDDSTEVGRKILAIKESVDKGNYIPDDLILALVREKLEQYVAESTFDPTKEILLLDGLPRTPSQLAAVERELDVLGIIYFSLTESARMERLLIRGIEQGRADDKDEETIQKRFDVYDNLTIPCLEAFDKQKLITLAAQGDVEQIHHNIVQALKDRNILSH